MKSNGFQNMIYSAVQKKEALSLIIKYNDEQYLCAEIVLYND